MIVLISLLAIVLSLVLVVGIHEAGHAWVAHLFKIKIKKISIGFGRPLMKWQGQNGCQWIWGMWPLGGYVQLLNSRIEPVSADEYPFSFDKKPFWVKCVVLLAGAFANLLAAWLALVLMLMIGYQQLSPVIASINVPSIASAGGLTEGDRILSIAEQRVVGWRDVGMQLIMALGQSKVDVVVENTSGVQRTLYLDLTKWRDGYRRGSLYDILGFTPDVSLKYQHEARGLPLGQATHEALLQMNHLIYFLLVIVKKFFTGIIPFAMLLGPLGLFTSMVDSFLQGMSVFLMFIAQLSLSVAIINLFPVPGLDGGSLIYALIEKCRGKPVSVAMEVLLHRLILIAFCMILVQLLLNDLQRFLQ